MRLRKESQQVEALWAHHHAELRDPHQIASQWQWSADVDPLLLKHVVRGCWWRCLEEANITLVVSREYEHLLMALCVQDGKPCCTYFRLPHPSGIACDAREQLVYVASTRNPNMVFDFAPCDGVLLPIRARYLPGRLYLHDLAVIGRKLYANAVGMNAVVRLPAAGGFEPVWWPRVIDGPSGPRFERNYLQVNSIAAGSSLASSFYSASADRPSARRPGHLNFPVDGRGVLFSGRTREVIATGLTRPHSARRRGREVWVDNSGYGQLGRIAGGRFEPVVRLPGWTRGLCFHEHLAFVGTSRVIPKFRHYAPGLDADHSQCGLHAVDLRTGEVLGSLIWPQGNQIFAIEAVPRHFASGFPFSLTAQPGAKRRQQALFFQGHSGRSAA
jgi:uncharacterized protein (TIGR03032 family)